MPMTVLASEASGVTVSRHSVGQPPIVIAGVWGEAWLTTNQLRWLVETGGPAALITLERGRAALAKPAPATEGTHP
jgi:hypothetical protein